MVELFELLQQGDLAEDGHGHAVLRQREPHLLQRHDRVRRLVARPVHGAVRACAKRRVSNLLLSGDISTSAGSILKCVGIGINWESIHNQFLVVKNRFFITIP